MADGAGHRASSISGFLAFNEAQKLVFICLFPSGRHNIKHMKRYLLNVRSSRVLEIAVQGDVSNRKRIVVHNREVGARDVRIDPTRTLVQLPAELWTIVGLSSTPPPMTEGAGLRRAGAKHRRVR